MQRLIALIVLLVFGSDAYAYLWCATVGGVSFVSQSEYGKDACAVSFGSVFASKSLAEAEHQRLKGTATASSSPYEMSDSDKRKYLDWVKSIGAGDGALAVAPNGC